LGVLRYYLRRHFCAVLPGSIAAVDPQAIAADRLFAVTMNSALNLQEVSLLRARLNAFGGEGESLNVQDLTVVEYTRAR
jgi:hypothetical protein